MARRIEFQVVDNVLWIAFLTDREAKMLTLTTGECVARGPIREKTISIPKD